MPLTARRSFALRFPKVSGYAIPCVAVFLAITAIPCAAGTETRLLRTEYLFAQPDASAPPRLIRAGDDRVKDEYMVIFNDDVLPDAIVEGASRLATIYGANIRKVWSHVVKGVFARMTEAQADLISRDPLVKYVEENSRFYFSAAEHPTYIDPKTCNPLVGGCPAVVDDRLWHLDRADQNSALPNNRFSYCTDGTAVTVYVVDSGVNKAHNEFANGSRVLPGVNTSGDSMPADDPCMGFALPPTPGYSTETSQWQFEVFYGGHGTTAASAVGGARVGVAKNVTIVPVKVSRCDQYSARVRISAHQYQQNETMYRVDSGTTTVYRALNQGTTAGTDPGGWPTADGSTRLDGTITWFKVPTSETGEPQTVQMIISGLDWILSPSNTSPHNNAVVTMSIYKQPAVPGVTGPSPSLENSIRNLLSSNITVIASANNQNGNACDTSPGRLSINNPDPAVRNDVITVGGSMVINRPWGLDISDVTDPNATVADGGGGSRGPSGPEPNFDATKGVREARWICGKGDSAGCSLCPTLNVAPACTQDPVDLIAYSGFTGGSNAGPCVTLFAPAKNLFLASVASSDGYRDARLRAASASGTSWSAPVVAGLAARILQANPSFTPVQVRTKLLENSSSNLVDDEVTPLNTYTNQGVEITGTPNKLVQFGDVNITAQPASAAAGGGGSATLTVGAGGTLLNPVTHQWYEVNASFDVVTFKRGAYTRVSTGEVVQSSAPIPGATTNTLNVSVLIGRKAYWVRVSNGCGSADSDIAVVVARPGAPSGLTAGVTGANVTVAWSAGANAEKYLVQRKVSGQWIEVGRVTAPGVTFTEAPSAPNGMVLYRVLSAAGVGILPENSLATSAPSNNDFTNVNDYTYEALLSPPEYTMVKAQHLVELRQAVNALCDAAGIATDSPFRFTSGELQLSSLQGKVIEDEDFTTLLTRINNVRADPLVGVGAASFSETPAPGLFIKREHLQSLRNALK